MRRAAAISALLLLLLAAPAGAWVESAAYDVPHGGVAACLRAAGPQRLSLLRPGRPRTTTTLLSLGAGVLRPGPAIPIGIRYACGAAGGADGAPLLAAWERVRGGRPADLALRVAAPGAAPVTVRAVHGRDVNDPAIAVAPGGAAVIAWSERPVRSLSDELLYASVRPSAGAAFGPAQPLSRMTGFAPEAAVGIDAAGRATVAWLSRSHAHTQYGSTSIVEVASSSADGGFGPPQRLGRSLGERVALAVAPDGRALLAADVVGELGGSLEAYERLPGGTRFAHVPLRSGGSSDDGLAVALAPDGGAAIAYRNDARSVTVALRPPGGAFGDWADVVPHVRSASGSAIFFADISGSPDDAVGRALRAALGPGGEVVLSWVDDARGRRAATAYAALGTLSGGMERPQRLGSPCRSAAGAVPVALPDGRIAVAWADNARAMSLDTWTAARGGGRVHVARGEPEGSAGAAAPRLTARLAGPRALAPGETLRVRVRCDVACDVRAVALARGVGVAAGGDGSGPAIWTAASSSLRAGASAVLRVPGMNGFDLAGARGKPRTPLVVSACAPAGALAQRLELAPPRIAAAPPLPRVVGLAAVRRGGAIRVTWSTAAPAVRTRFYVSTVPAYPRVTQSVAGHGRRRFAVTLAAGRRRVRRVQVTFTAPATWFGPVAGAPVR